MSNGCVHKLSQIVHKLIRYQMPGISHKMGEMVRIGVTVKVKVSIFDEVAIWTYHVQALSSSEEIARKMFMNAANDVWAIHNGIP